jgi:hypothetical protein
MAPRVELQALLESILGSDQVHFQPPADLEMAYPAIVYKRDNAHTEFADNLPFLMEQRYQVTYISRNPDDDAVRKALMSLPKTIFNRYFAMRGLNHDVYLLYF